MAKTNQLADYPDVAAILDILKHQLDIQLSPPTFELEGAAYAACSFTAKEHFIRLRMAKSTPIKVGHFVTLWKRNDKGITSPFDESDTCNLIIISVKQESRLGLFVFPKTVLVEQKIFSTGNKDGKRGFRVYPPWYDNLNPQATKTQHWQSSYFVELNPHIDLAKSRQLLKITV